MGKSSGEPLPVDHQEVLTEDPRDDDDSLDELDEAAIPWMTITVLLHQSTSKQVYIQNVPTVQL
jgi:hypothetical protein